MIGLETTPVEDDEEGESIFMSMTDMMVGMLFVFILMLMAFALNYKSAESSSQEQQEDVRAAIAQVRSEVIEVRDIERQRTELLRDLQRSLKQVGVEVDIDTQNGVLRLPDEILFDLNSAELNPVGTTALGRVADALAQILPCYGASGSRPSACPERSQDIALEALFVEGHTDSTGSDQRNWTLSANRAISTFRALTEAQPSLLELSNARGEMLLSVSGYAAYRPIASNDTEAGRSRNRRIDLRVVLAVSHVEAMERIQRRLQEIIEP